MKLRIFLMTVLVVPFTMGCNPQSTDNIYGTRSTKSTENKAFEQMALEEFFQEQETTDAQQESPEAMFAKAQRLAREGKSADAVRWLDRVLEERPDSANAYHFRGREYFRLGEFKKSLVDFDKFLELRPDKTNSLWERGITLYYLNRFVEGSEQFKLYQKFENNDVENSVWQFLCNAKNVGIESSRNELMAIENDSRIPLMKVYGLFRGELEPTDVTAAIQRDNPNKTAVDLQNFYANLYLGLYYDAHNQPAMARKHIDLAAGYQIDGKPPANNYMWDVARLHAKKLDKESGDKH